MLYNPSMAFTSHKKVLVTGGAGVIGSALVPYLLNEQFTVYLLLPASSPEDLEERFQNLIRFWALPPYETPAARAREHVIPLAGSVRLPKFGLPEERYKQLCSTLTHIVHAGTGPKLNMNKDEVELYYVIPAYHVCEFLNDGRKSGNDLKLEYVSTIGVGGKLKGSIEERIINEKRVYHNTYESGRARAEAVIEEGINRGFKITVHRPSMVVGHSSAGTINRFQVFYQMCEFLTGKYTLGVLPELRDFKVDIIPVDYAVKFILWSMKEPASCGQVLHICAGPAAAVSMPQLRKIVAEGLRSRRQPFLVPDAVFVHLVQAMMLLAPASLRKKLKILPYFLQYIHEAQIFETQRTVSMASGEKIDLPDVRDYLRSSLEFYFAKRMREDSA